MSTEQISLLESAISNAKDDKSKVDRINQLAFEIRNSDTERSIALSKEAQTISSRINYSEGRATAITNEAFGHVQITDYKLALEKLFEALKIFEALQNEKGIAQVHYNLTLIYFRFSDFNNGLDSITKALAYYKKVNDVPEMARSLFQLGFLYHSLNDYESAIEYFNESLKLHREIKNPAGEAAAIMGLGQIYLNKGEYEKSKEKLFESMAIREQIKDWRGYGAALNAYMTLCMQTGKNEEAEKISLQGIKLATELGDKMGVARFRNDLGKIYLNQNKLKEAEEVLLESLEIAERINLRMALSPIHFSLSEIYQLKGDFEKALKHFQRFHKVKEEMLNTDAAMKAKSAQLVNQIESAQKEAEINHLKNVELKKAYGIIEEKNKDITDSINYAKRIQQAILPKTNEIYSTLSQCFVLYKPKDIVSGDFYFFHKNNTASFIAAVDCTGHGVPGAFMSMIGSEKLEDAVLQSSDTSQILKLLNKGIKTSLRQSDSDESTRDGMDIALCSIDTNKRIVKYAGANRPIWIISKGKTEVQEIKATKKAIGGFTEDEQHFDTHEIQLQQGDTFYLTTDGYADTFSGKDSKKLTTKKFKQILLDIQHQTMPEQKQHLNNFIENWKSGTEQVDDILVIGIRL